MTDTFQIRRCWLVLAGAWLPVLLFAQERCGATMNIGQHGTCGLQIDSQVRSELPTHSKSTSLHEVEVFFHSRIDRTKLAGTLTLPSGEGPFAAAILLSGSGPQNRDSEIAGHKIFKLLADHLAREGIAVLRFDDRGTGRSAGDFNQVGFDEIVSDATAAFRFLESRSDITANRICLIGHSEGGLVACAVAGSLPVHAVVLLNSPGQNGRRIALQQIEEFGRAEGLSNAVIQTNLQNTRRLIDLVTRQVDQNEFDSVLDQMLDDYANRLPDHQAAVLRANHELFKQQYQKMLTPWYRDFLTLDPMDFLKKVKCPVLVIAGGKDTQVSMKENVQQITKGLRQAQNQDVTVKRFSGLNHLLQPCQTGHPLEYAATSRTIDHAVLVAISEWLSKRLSNSKR